MKFTLDKLNKASSQEFAAALGGIFERSAWVAERAAGKRPFADVVVQETAERLRQAFVSVANAYDQING